MNNNLFAVWKPKGPTSNDILNKIRRACNTKKVGHAGTLDPLASGILVVGIGRNATKQLGTAMQDEKEYIATIYLGANSSTDDDEGEKTIISPLSKLEENQIQTELKNFTGKIMQTPPIYSAIKIAGKSAYKYAREGKEIELSPREVEVKSIEILSFEWPRLKLRIGTGKGVYIRSIARDLGSKLKTGGYLSDLVRTRVGNFTERNAISLDQLPTLCE